MGRPNILVSLETLVVMMLNHITSLLRLGLFQPKQTVL